MIILHLYILLVNHIAFNTYYQFWSYTVTQWPYRVSVLFKELIFKFRQNKNVCLIVDWTDLFTIQTWFLNCFKFKYLISKALNIHHLIIHKTHTKKWKVWIRWHFEEQKREQQVIWILTNIFFLHLKAD